MKYLIPGPIVLAALLCAAPSAFAHAFLTHASPAVGSTVNTPPTSLHLFFTEGVAPRFSSVQLLDTAGTPLHTGPLQTAQGGREVIVPVPEKLSSGKYTVVWHATAEDTHKTEGKFGFTVAP